MVMTPVEQENSSETPSRLLDYLPSVFREDKMMNRFLMIFESIFNPIENTIDNTALYFDPQLTPEAWLPWLSSWLDMALDAKWPLEKRRNLVSNAAELYRWRGTRRGLSEYLKIYTGITPEIIEHVPGMILDEKSQLGVNTILGSSGSGHHFAVVLELDEHDNLDRKVIQQIIESQKPAHTVYTLQINTSGKS